MQILVEHHFSGICLLTCIYLQTYRWLNLRKVNILTVIGILIYIIRRINSMLSIASKTVKLASRTILSLVEHEQKCFVIWSLTHSHADAC